MSSISEEMEVEEEEIEGEEVEDGEDEEEKETEEMEEEEMDEEVYEAIKHLLMAIQAVVHMLNEFVAIIRDTYIKRPLTRRPISRIGYSYIHKSLKHDPQDFRQLYRMYPDVFRKLCCIIREKTLLQDTKYVCIEEMLGTFLLTVGQNSRYCQTRNTFGRSHFTASNNFNKILKALNTIATEMMTKPGPTMPTKIRKSTRFYPYFKVNVVLFIFIYFIINCNKSY